MASPLIKYNLHILNPNAHYLSVVLRVEDVTDSKILLAIPVWIPGSYLVREFARNIKDFHAQGFEKNKKFKTLKWKKIDKHTWEVDAKNVRSVEIKYNVYAYEPFVQTSFVDNEHATINPSGVFMYLLGRTEEPLSVVVHPLKDWEKVSTSLNANNNLAASFQDNSSKDIKPYYFTAKNYDELIDSPIEMGNHETYRFTVKKIPHEIAIYGFGNYNSKKLVDDTKKIVFAASGVIGEIPYNRYLFIMQVSPGRWGGLEHCNSTLMQFPSWKFEPRDEYRKSLSLIAHEYFHCWNVKRLKPSPFETIDYTKENYTQLLWFAEGVTSYYDELILRRAGLVTEEEYLQSLSRDYKEYLETPGRHVQSLEDASFDTWIKFYRPNENSKNATISYYLKGSLVGCCLDLEIRYSSNGKHSLDELLRKLYKEFVHCNKSYTANDLQLMAEKLTGKSWERFFKNYISGTKELDLNHYLGYAGLKLFPKKSFPASKENVLPVYLGIEWKKDNNKLIVSVVFADSPAMIGGLAVGDEIIALDGIRVDDAAFPLRLAERKPGAIVKVLLARRELVREISVKLEKKRETDFVIVKQKKVSLLQRKNFESWLKPS